MSNAMQKLTAALILAASASSVPDGALAVPIANGPAIGHAAPTAAQPIRWGGGWHGGWRGGWWGPGAGFLAGAIIGGALVAPYYYGYDPYYGPYYPGPYYPGPYYPRPAYGVAAPSAQAAAYCAQRFKSYDPQTGTYLGYDGYRHPCP